LASTINAKSTGSGSVETTADASGQLALQANGATIATISSTGLAVTGTITNNGVTTSPYTMKNRIINGDMVIDQRNAGASVALPDGSASYSFVVDRWLASRATVATATAQQSSDVPTGQGFVNSFVVTNGTASTSGSTAEGYIGQLIEGYNIADLGWGTASAKTVTLSFWVKSSIAGTHSGSLVNSGGSQTYPFSYSISTANTWEQKTITVAGSTSGTWLTTNGRGLFVAFNNGAGSSYLGTANAWTNSIKYGVTGSVALNSVTGSTWYITGVQLEVGSYATPFEWRPYTTELQLCQRYYWKFTGPSYAGVCAGYSNSTTGGNFIIKYPVTMRSAPTFSTGGLSINNTAGNYAVTSVASGYAGTDTAFTSIAVASGLTAGQGCVMTINSAGTGYLDGTSEL